MRKKDENLHRKLLGLARQIASTSGPESITIRSVAEKAGIATGTLYNYFSSKDDILLTLTEEYWRNTLSDMQGEIKTDHFCDHLEEVYLFLSQRIETSAGMLMGSLQSAENLGRERMQSMQQELGKALVQCMELDTAIRQDIWTEHFTKEQYASFILMNMMLLLRMKSHNIKFLLEIVKRTLY